LSDRISLLKKTAGAGFIAARPEIKREEVIMRMSAPSVDEAVDMAEALIAMRPSQLVLKVQDLMLNRELSRTVAALNELVLDHPPHRQLAVQALSRMGLWLEPNV
jgi:hypothetical protein